MRLVVLILNLMDCPWESSKEQGMRCDKAMDPQISPFIAEVIGTIFFFSSMLIIPRSQTVPSLWPLSLGLDPQSPELGVKPNSFYLAA